MNYKIFGPIAIERDAMGRILSAARVSFRSDADGMCEGLADACGCYVFGIKTSGSKGPRPWYVGKAEKQTFTQECFTDHKLDVYNSALADYARCIPVIFLYARVVKSGRFSNPTTNKHKDVGFLENMLIGYAIDRNQNLSDIKQTALLRNLRVPGLLNTGQGAVSKAAQRAAKLMGY